MKKSRPISPNAATLRRRAKQKLRDQPPVEGQPPSKTEARALVHKLQVHQTELEMQNDELSRAQLEAAKAMDQLRAANDTLRVNEERLKLVLQASSMGTFEVDLRTGEERWNATEFELLGLQPGDTPPGPETFFRFVHPEDAGPLRAQWEEALRIGKLDTEFRIIRADGEVRWLAGRGQFQFSDQSGGEAANVRGEDLRFLGVNFDITARKHAQEALTAAHAEMARDKYRLEAVMQALPVGLAILDARGGKIQANPAFDQIWGGPCPPTKAVTDYAAYRAHWVDTGQLVQPGEWASARAVEHGETVVGQEMELHRFDGTRAFVLNSATPIRDAKGYITGCAVAIMDITARKRAEMDLLQNRQDLDRAQEVGQIGSWRLDVQRNVLSWSDENHRIFGVPKEMPLTYETFLGIVHPEDRHYVDARWQAGLRGEPYDVEHRLLVDGQVKWVREKAYLEFDAAGHLLGGFGITQDITARKASEARLAWLASFPGENPNPVTEIDLASGHVTFANPSARRLFPDLIGQGAGHLWLDGAIAMAGPLRAPGDGAMRREATVGEACYHQTLSLSPDRQRLRIYGMDITARKRAEEKLRELNAELEQRVAESVTEIRAAYRYARGLLEVSLDPLVTISETGKITDVNDASVQATGVPREQLIGMDFSNFFTEPDRAREGYQRVFAEGFVRDYPLAIRHVSGRVTDVLYNATVFRNESGDVQGVFAAARDVTERKRVEGELARHREHLEELVKLRTAELARSNEELEQFAYVASHDLQEPLRAVTGYLGLIEQRFRDALDEKSRHQIAGAVQGAVRMNTLITDLLALSRVGTQGQAFVPVDLNVVLDHALGGLAVSLRETGARITREPLPTLNVDASQMAQLFQNLIGNALKFRGEPPPEIHLSAQRQAGQWLLAVRDNGIGIEPQYFERIFLIFQRLYTRRQYPGTGIGLAICKKIVERHGGRIWVESQPGAGSTFFFTLPDPL